MESSDAKDGSTPLAGPLGRRLLGWLLLFSLGPLFLSNTLGYVRSQGIIMDLTERYLAALADVEAQHVRSQVKRYLLDLTAIAAGNDFLSAGALRLTGEDAGPMGLVAGEAAVESHLRRKIDELKAFQALYLHSPDGRLLASTGPIPEMALRSVDAPSAIPDGITGLSQISGPDGPLFRLSVGVPGIDGVGIASYLCALISYEGLEAFLEISPHLAGSIESYILDAEGRPLFVSHPHGPVDYFSRATTPTLDSLPGAFARYENAEGVEVIGVNVMVPDLPWRYLAEAPVADALGPLQTLRRTSFLVEALMSGLLVLAAWLVARGIVGPVGRLVDATRTVASGNLSVRVRATQTDEIGELGRAFNEMADGLEEARTRVAKLHQRELERAAQLATVGELASGVAHEIKNPLVGISNGFDLVRRKLKGQKLQGEGSLDPILEEMGRQLLRIERAIRDLLAFARPPEPTLEKGNLYEVVERAVRLVQPAAEREGVTIELHPALGLSPTWMDGELIGQAVVNLIMNAVHATSQGGTVAVRLEATEEGVEIAVRDSGRGVPSGDLEQIFKPFYTTRHNGTGLGLSITREIVRRHGGTIEVVSRVGEGATFTMFLPRQSGKGGDAEPAAVRVRASASDRPCGSA
ncbi:MAG: ATP-binding protein [Longimicrobiales bacterium]|nr:ATP-binding protein [Longimicrobiales bacterium]